MLEQETIETREIVISADSVRTAQRLYNKPISDILLDPRQINQVPQFVETDLLRSLQTLPGILPISDFSSELYVRGGTPDQNLYLIDGADVYNPEHFFGLFSTFNTDAIKNVEMSKGGFGAEYGGRLSSILNVTNLDGNRNGFEGKASISLLSAKTTLQMPLGKKGSLSGSIRRTYFDKTLAKAVDDIPDYYFWDGHLKAFFDLDDRNKLTVSSYSGRDDLDYTFDTNSDDVMEIDYDWGNNTASLQWTHIFSPVLFGNFWLTGSTFRSDFSFEIINEQNKINDLTLKGDLEYFYSKQWSAKFGFEMKNLEGLLKQDFPGGHVDVSHTAQHIIGYAQGQWRPSPLVEIQAGLRYDNFRAAKVYQNLAPRASVKYRLTDTANLKAAAGIYHQYLYRIPRTFFVDIWTSADEYYAGSTAVHYILGFQKEIARNYEFEIETYYKDYTNIYAYSYFFWVDIQPVGYNQKGEPVYGDSRGLFDRGTGTSMGIELLFRKDTGLATGWLSYSLGRTRYRIDGVNHNQEFPPRHDRASTINVVGKLDVRNAFRLLRGHQMKSDRTTWGLGFGLVYASGQPITTTSSIYFTQPLPDQLYDDGLNLYPTQRNNFRLPAYARFDLSLTMEKKYKHWTLSPYLQVFNLGNRKNVWFIQYEREIEGNTLKQEIDTITMLPILPTIGVNINF
ncbi:hypothetical protein A2V82_02840 [candidate division KSB1 bacterium RBG_16_48_16]|nr:MAG: hypothetical protein A2V82_02840 [candidate division KSB1 bacterium RBG_16_48_16]